MTTAEPIIEVHGLAKSYGNFQAVKGIDVQVPRGSIFGFLGPNGAGKTTTISILSCLLRPSAGEVRVANFDAVQHPMEVKRRIGLVPQDLAIYPNLSARENLSFFGRLYGLNGTQLKRRVEQTLEMVGLRERGNDPVGNFSGGMKRRINIAAGLLHEPDVLFMDEPTVGVDPQSRNAIFESVEQLNQTGMTILYTTHYMEEAQRLCDRLVIIDLGRVIAEGSPDELINSLGGGMIQIDGDEAMRTQIAALPGVRSVTLKDGLLEITASPLQEALVTILNYYSQHGRSVHTLEVLEPNLETVFLHLTGKRLRD